MKSRRYKIILIICIIISSALLASFDWAGSFSNQTVDAIADLDGELVDRPAPGFDLKDATGKEYKLSAFRGQVVFLNFWASFCAPCRKEMPSMESLVRQYKPQGLTMVAISQDPNIEDMTKFMNTFLPGQQSEMTVLWDENGDVARSYGTSLIPETYLIDRNGVVVARFVNAYDWNTPKLKALIEALLRGEKKQRWL